MRLINVETLQLSEFFGSNVPKYTILSHTWGTEEITFSDMQSVDTAAFDKRGFQKIRYLCQETKKRGLRWAWLDTCCIDKTSSAELSEAINSMYNWYRKSEICFVYLVDVPSKDRPRDRNSQFRRSRWFSRGWTLQELIAPEQVEFYSGSWTFLGDKILLFSLLNSITGIPKDLLVGADGLTSFSIAQRMSWAASRVTTRTEDVAYSLLGLFDINMPLLYGEGTKAFQRLQKEIITQTDDQSIFTWSPRAGSLAAWTLAGALATSPADFKSCSDVIVLHDELGQPSAVTKKGVYVNPYVTPATYPPTTHLHNYCNPPGDRGPRIFQIGLNCSESRVGSNKRIILLIMRFDRDHAGISGNSFLRLLAPGLLLVANSPIFTSRTKFSSVFICMENKKNFQASFSKGGLHFHGIPVAIGAENLLEPSGPTPSWALRHCDSEINAARSPVDLLTLDKDCRYVELDHSYSAHFASQACDPSKGGEIFSLSSLKYNAKSIAFTITGLPVREDPVFICGVASNFDEDLSKRWTVEEYELEGEEDRTTGVFCFLVPRPQDAFDRQWAHRTYKSNLRCYSTSSPDCYGNLGMLKAKCGSVLLSVTVHCEIHEDENDDVTRRMPHILFIFNREELRGSNNATGMLDWTELWGYAGDGSLTLHSHDDFRSRFPEDQIPVLLEI